MPRRAERSIVARSGQTWKLALGGILLVVGFAVMVYGIRGGALPGRVEWALRGMALSLLSFFGTCAAVRCPACGMRWLWAAVRQQEHSQWLTWLATQKTCPGCGKGDPST